MARPTKYSAELLEVAKQYLVNYEELGDVVPTVAGLACEMQINKDTIYDWIKHEDKHEFSVTVKEIAHIQERKLISGGLSGAMNSMITKLLLNNHGYNDKIEQNVTSTDGSLSSSLKITVVSVNEDE